MPRTSRPTQLIIILSLLLGSWMIFDGSRKLATGLFTGEDSVGLGPWANLVTILGIEPASMALLFILLGTVWIVNAALLIIGGPLRYERVIVVSAITLFYLIPGTIVSTITLLIALEEKRRYSRLKMD